MSIATSQAARILAKADTLLVDSRLALAFARENGLAVTAKILSRLPRLLKSPA